MKLSLSPEDYKTIATLHCRGIPFGFLSSLGQNFLAKLYAGIACAPGSCVLVERDESGAVIGFVSGTLSINRCYRHVLTRRFFSLGLVLLPKLFSPSRIRRIIETLVYPKQKEATHGHIRTELLSIAVSDSARGKGVGKRLVRALEDFFAGQGHAGPYKVVTWAGDPRSNAFYTGVGFTLNREFTHHAHKMNEYVK